MIAGAAAAQVAKDQMDRAQRAEPAPTPPARASRTRVAIAAALRRAAARIERPAIAR